MTQRRVRGREQTGPGLWLEAEQTELEAYMDDRLGTRRASAPVEEPEWFRQFMAAYPPFGPIELSFDSRSRAAVPASAGTVEKSSS